MADKTPQLDTPHIRVTMADGREFDVQTENPDMVLFDLERSKRKWPTFQEAPFLWISYLAYSKLKRSGADIGGDTFDAWLLKTSNVSNLNADGAPGPDVVAAFPTQEVPAPG
jgi:hypothetical protein